MKYTLSTLIAGAIMLLSALAAGWRRKDRKPGNGWLVGKPAVYTILTALTFTGGVLVRLYGFGTLPGGLFIDEAILGYDANAILNYGVDHNGMQYPVHLASFGGGQHALYAYLSMPFIALRGLDAFSIRLVNLIFGVLSLGLFYLLVLRTDGQKTALAALFLLSVNPWHIMISRWGLECNLLPGVFLLATWLLVRWLQGGRTFALSMLVYGLCFYAYGTAYAAVPIFLLIIGGYLWAQRRLEVRKMLAGGVVLVLTALPAGLYVAVNRLGWESLRLGRLTIPRLPAEARFNQLLSIGSGGQITERLAYHASLALRLLVTQQDGYAWNAVPGFGFIYLFSLPVVLGGIWAMVREWRAGGSFRTNVVHLAWLGAGAGVALLIPVNINRMNILILPLIYLAARGLAFACEHTRFLGKLLVLLTLGWFGLFAAAYFGGYRQVIDSAFNQSLGEAIQDASRRTEGTVYITRAVHLPYAYVLFYEKPSPDAFLETVQYEDEGAEFRDAVSFGRYRFMAAADMPPGGGAYVVENREIDQVRLGGYSIVSYDIFSVLVPE